MGHRESAWHAAHFAKRTRWATSSRGGTRSPSTADQARSANAESAATTTRIEEVWFRGAHCDVVGGPNAYWPLADITLDWMLDGVVKAGAIIRRRMPAAHPAPTELDALAEGARSLRFRKVPDDALVHASVDVYLRAHPDYWRRLPWHIVWSDLDWAARAERLPVPDTTPTAKVEPRLRRTRPRSRRSPNALPHGQFGTANIPLSTVAGVKSQAMAQNWPVVQRDNEYTTIQSALVDQQGVCGIVLVGDAGVGKTTLARLVTQSLPTRVQWVAGTESARSIPLGVFAHLVGAATSRDPVAFLAAARETILSEGHSVIGVDDAHLLDQLSATLLHQLALDGSVRIVATVRSGETVPDAITSLWKDGYLQRLHLMPFTKEQCVTLIESALGGRVEGLSADLMWESSGGNALFVRHLVEGALEAGTLRQVRGVWQLRGRTAVTSELASLLDSRVDQLPDNVLHALRLLTFCEPLDLDTLSSIAGVDAVEEAENRGLIRVVEEHTGIDVRFNHPLFGEVIRRRLGMAAARRLRGEVVRALQGHPLRGPTDRIRLAELTLDSDESPEVDLLVSAARDAIALTNVTLGERLARAAVNRGGGLVASELLARSLLWQGNSAEAEETLSAFDPDQMNELELVRWGLVRIANLHWSMGDAEGADEVLDLLCDRVTHPGLKLVVAGVASASRLFENQLEEAVELSKLVLARPRRVRRRGRMGGVRRRAGAGVDGPRRRGRGGRRTRASDRRQGRRAAALFDRVRRGSRARAQRRLRHRRKTIRRHRADHIGGPVPGVGHGQCSRRHRRTRARPVRRHRVPHGADRRRADIGVGGVVELPRPPAAGAVVLRAGPCGCRRQDGGRAADPKR